MNYSFDISSCKERVFGFLQRADAEFSPPLSYRVDLYDYSKKLAKEAINIFIISNGSDVAHAAFYCNDRIDRVAYLSSIAVISDYQGLGIAEELLTMVFNKCVAVKMRFIRLEVDPRNVKAVKFYHKLGFRFDSESFMIRELLDCL